jgi:preprotein translocase subunit SecD
MTSGVTPLLRFLAIAFVYLCWCPIAAAETLVLDIRQVKADIQKPGNEPVIVIVLTDASARIFAEVTGKNVGNAMEVRVDGRSVVKAVVREPILGGTVTISGRFSRKEVDGMVARLSSSATKLEFEVESSGQ